MMAGGPASAASGMGAAGEMFDKGLEAQLGGDWRYSGPSGGSMGKALGEVSGVIKAFHGGHAG